MEQINLKEEQLILKSPVDGIILDLPAKQEQVINPGTLLATVAVSEKLEVKADLLSDDLGEVSLGQRVQITAPVLGDKTWRGK
nr:HlyD family efflux transporter periplasmic adaptor subunit [Desulforamulus aquiferis]